MTDPRPKSCDRARLWVSLALDNELSDFEDRLLDAHLERCADCREYEQGVRAATLRLRAEPLVANERQVALPRPRPALGVTRLAASAAAAALIAVGITGFFAVSGGNQRPHLLDRVGRSQNTEAADLRALRRSEIASQRQPVKPQHIQIGTDTTL
jgi:predicted anti-sigma-YlaC factor YlaD